jgi:hypothetical protein
MSGDNGEGLWYQWTPINAESVAYEDVAQAVEGFESLENPAGRAATAWLKDEALANHPSTVTYVLMRDGRVEGFIAMASASVTLKQSHRKKLGPGQRDYPLSPTQGASLVAWLAKHREAETAGSRLLAYALSIALDVARLQGTVAFVLDPYDEESAAQWMNRHRFRRSETEARAGLRRLWIPLHPQ